MSASIDILRQPIGPERLNQLVAEVFGDMVKFVVDVERGIVAVGGEMHVDAEALLLEDGSRQEDLWGGNFVPAKNPGERIEFTSLINIRPAQDNLGMFIHSADLRHQVRDIVERLIAPGVRT